MESVYLGDYIDNATDQIERAVPRLAAGQASWHEVQALCTWYRQRGVCSLLLTGVPRTFHINMMQSAAAFLHFLAACPDAQKIGSQAKPFFDALCAGHLDAARGIARMAPDRWHQGQEYEDDFLYVAVLMALVAEPAGPQAAQRAEQLEVAAQGAEPFRVQACQALLERDLPAFEAALEDNLAARVDYIDGLLRSGGLPQEFGAWLCHFSSEGCALVRIAESLGLPAAGPYLHVPQATRAPSPFAFDPAAWRQVDYRP